MSPRKIRSATVAAAAVALLVLVGCAPGDDGGGEPERVYAEGIGPNPPSLNPQLTTSPTAIRVSRSMLETLVGTDVDYGIQPVLARDWEFSDDGLDLTLNLEEEVTWHDGEPFTSEDVAFNLEEFLPLHSSGAELAAVIDSIDTPDENTVVLHLSEQFGPILEALSEQFMLPKHLFEGTDYVTNPANDEPVGTGPMMFESFTPDEQIVVVKNEDWWQGDTEVDRAVFAIQGDASARAMSLFAGELDLATVEANRHAEVQEDPDMHWLDRGYFPSRLYVAFNTRNEVLSDPAVRALVYSAIDRTAVAEDALSGLGEPARSLIPPINDWAVHPDIDLDEEFPVDLDAIAEGLDEAGYPVQDDGWRFTLDLRYITGLNEVELTTELMTSTMKDVGIRLNLISGVNAVWTEKVFEEGDFDLTIQRGRVSADPSLSITQWYTCNPDGLVGRNPSGICDEQIDAAADGALNNADREVRAEHLYKLQERATELVFHMPIAWSTAAYQTVNSSRWAGLDDPKSIDAIDWLGLTWKG